MTFTGARVLLVEDEPIVAMCLEDILSELGCVIVGPAAGLDEGLAIAQREKLDGAILDINLQGQRSYPIAKALLKRGVPFVFASGYGGVDETTGIVAPLIPKPYSEAQIAAALDEMLGGDF
jgi:CheY-like chemotaxis protein